MNKNNLMFSAYEYFEEHNDESLPSLESLIEEMDGYINHKGTKYSVKDIKNEISNA